MIDRIFAPFLTFALLIGGTAAVASSLFMEQAAPAAATVAQSPAKAVIVLETVVITGKRKPA